MKKLTGIILVSLILFTFTSCANEDGSSSNSGFPTDLYSEENLEELGFEQFLYIGPLDDYYRGEEDALTIISLVEPVDWEFILNGQEIDFVWEYYDEGWWQMWVEYDELEGIDFSPGNIIDYYLSVNNKSYQGQLEMLEELYVDWPEFDFDENFEFNWDIDENPQIYNISCDGHIEEEKNDYEFYEYWQITGDIDEFSISKNIYGEYEDVQDFEISISIYAINYINHGKCLAWTEIGDYYSHGNWDKGTQKKIDPKERIWRTIEMFQQKFNH